METLDMETLDMNAMITSRAIAVQKIKDNLCRDVAEFIKDFGTDLTVAEKLSIKALTCLDISAEQCMVEPSKGN